jgi:hypothetical protein
MSAATWNYMGVEPRSKYNNLVAMMTIQACLKYDTTVDIPAARP